MGLRGFHILGSCFEKLGKKLWTLLDPRPASRRSPKRVEVAWRRQLRGGMEKGAGPFLTHQLARNW